jgi:hypothetical protein
VGALHGGSRRRPHSETNGKRPALTGQEILLELSDESGKMPDGIYTLDLREKKPVPRLFMKNGTRPAWDPARKLIAYTDGRSLWAARNDGTRLLVDVGLGQDLEREERPVQWLRGGGFIVVRKSFSAGSCVQGSADGEGGGESGRWSDFLLFPPSLKQARSIGSHDSRFRSYSTKAMDMSPDKKQLAEEVGPYTPNDLFRGDSRVYVVKAGSDSSQFGRRLTILGNGTCEMSPLWSPDGKWIAFTVVNFSRDYVAPAVCQPDGRSYAELLPKGSQFHTDYPPTCAQWIPTSRFDLQPEAHRQASTSSSWGALSIRPLEWSDDGKYLLLAHGSTQPFLAVAKYAGGSWQIRYLGCPSAPGRAAFGPSKNGHCRLASTDGTNICVVDLGNTLNASSTRKIIPTGATIRWLDW